MFRIRRIYDDVLSVNRAALEQGWSVPTPTIRFNSEGSAI
jgi:hypothetical protein